MLRGRHPRRGLLPALILPLCLGLLPALPGQATAAGIRVPPLEGYVNDRAGLLTRGERVDLGERLRAEEERTSNQIAVLTIPSLEGEPVEEFAIRVARSWQLGQKGRNNGVLLLVAQEERNIRIEVGYGLEGALTDAESKLIIANIMVPAFRQGRFGQGILLGVAAIIEAVEGEYAAISENKDEGSGWQEPCLQWALALLLIFLSFVFRERGGRRSARRGLYGGLGGFGGGVGGGGFSGGRGSFGGGGGFSGGGGSFGGGGASGGW